MDDPATSMRKGLPSARNRSNRASDSAFVLDIAGLPVLVRGADAERHAVLVRVFGTTAACDDAPRVELDYGADPLEMPGRAPDVRQPDLDIWLDGDVMYVAWAYHDVRARVSPTRAEVFAPRADERGFRRMFQPVITHVLAHHDIFVLHAASMRVGSRGIVALGDSGKGKSTIALAAMQAGWDVMGDDLVALWLVDGAPTIRGLPKPLALPNDLVEGDEIMGDAGEVPDWDGRRRLHIPAAHLDLDAVPLHAIVVVEHGTTARSSVEALDASAATSRFMSSYTSVGDHALMRRFFPVATRAAHVPRWLVRHGRDAQTRVSDAQAILRDIFATD